GTPFSRLFVNVREKMSLCYYCAARFDRVKGIMLVDCGVENENILKAKDEILNQLEVIKRGEFSDDEFNNTRLSLINSLKTVGDSAGSMEIWYLAQRCYGTENSPDDDAKRLEYITKQDIIDAANQILLDTVYVLTSITK
ncbi:MAG: insulinase family protein, partial [Oscillospiraceae bacterium]|nr:insulinase family protein [Oscillospiraceae bacterium]